MSEQERTYKLERYGGSVAMADSAGKALHSGSLAILSELLPEDGTVHITVRAPVKRKRWTLTETGESRVPKKGEGFIYGGVPTVCREDWDPAGNPDFWSRPILKVEESEIEEAP